MMKNQRPECLFEITVRDFLGMTSGLGDYNDPKLQAWTYGHPDEDWTPINLLQNVSRYLYFKPGCNSFYFSKVLQRQEAFQRCFFSGFC
eukprot:UN13176